MRHTLWPLSLILLACNGPLPFEETGPLDPESEGPRSYAEGSPTRIADLPVGKTIEVEYHSQGCFHDTRALLTLTHLDLGFRVSIRYQPGEAEYSTPVSRMLTDAEVAALDDEWRIVREVNKEWICTTRTEYRISLDGAVTESLSDGACALSVRMLEEGEHAPAPATSFGRLVWEVAEPILLKEREASRGS